VGRELTEEQAVLLLKATQNLRENQTLLMLKAISKREPKNKNSFLQITS
jgi:hypothetical protein